MSTGAKAESSTVTAVTQLYQNNRLVCIDPTFSQSKTCVAAGKLLELCYVLANNTTTEFLRIGALSKCQSCDKSHEMVVADDAMLRVINTN